MGVRLLLSVLLFTGAARAEGPSYSAPTSKAEFCAMHKVYGGVRAQLFNPANHLSFSNPPGYFGAGLCWWHSRFQRAATYLADYRPLEKKPGTLRALDIINNIFRLNKVTVIPGYSNLQDFSRDYFEVIVGYLSNMQIEDTADAEFLRGLRAGNVTAGFIKRQVERLYKRVAIDDKVQFVLTKNGKTWYESHAWLVIGAVKDGEKYEFYYVDSEFSPQVVPRKFEYKPGDTKLNNRAPYLQHDFDFLWINWAVSSYCR